MNINEVHWNFSDNGTKEPAKSRFWNFYNFWTAWNFLMRFSLLCSGEWALSFYMCVSIYIGVSLKYLPRPDVRWAFKGPLVLGFFFVFFFRETPTSPFAQFRVKFWPLGQLFRPSRPLAWSLSHIKDAIHSAKVLISHLEILIFWQD